MKVEVWGRVRNPDGKDDLLRMLRSEGLRAWSMRNGVLYQLNSQGEDDGVFDPVDLPEGSEVDFMLHATEEGGATATTGAARTVGGLSGKPLRPYHVPRDPTRERIDAFFAVPGRAVVAQSVRNISLSLRCHGYEENEDGQVLLTTEELWRGPATRMLPGRLDRYRDMALAAEAKAMAPTPDCRRPFYIAR